MFSATTSTESISNPMYSLGSSSNAGRRLKRTKRAQKKTPPQRRGRVPQAIATRGTPAGYYEITRTTSHNITYSNLGFSIGAGTFQSMSFIFTPVDTTVFGSITNFATVNIPNAAEFAALFDRVKIVAIDVTIRPRHNTQVDSTAGTVPSLWVATDTNTATTPLTMDEIKQRADCRLVVCNANSGEGVTRFRIKPSFNRVVYYTAVTSSYEPCRGYCNTGIAIPHYSLHVGNDTPSGMGNGAIEFGFRFIFRFKDIK